MYTYKKNNIETIARKITCNSDLFGDETMNVVASLAELSSSANELGCAIEGVVPDCWGGKVRVLALPDRRNRRYEWVF